MNQLSASEYEQVLVWLEACTPILWSLTKAFPRLLQFEELHQDTFLYLVDRYPQTAAKRCPVAYAKTCVRWNILNKYKAISEQAITLSLDMPVASCESGDVCLGDSLIADQQVTEEELEQEDRLRQALHEALRRLPLVDQQHIRNVYELNDYEPVPLYPYARNVYKDRNISRHALLHLRRDATLAKQLYG